MEIVEKLIRDCLNQGIRHFVLCPGARNAPVVLTLQRSPEVECYYHPDERSAAFFALGRTMALEEPCAVVMTSGTAVAECLPAVIEAHYQGRPLVILSADRPSYFRGSGAPQSIEQVGLFSQYAHFGADYEVDSQPFADWSQRMPLHINLPLEEEFDEAHFTGVTNEYTEFKPARIGFDGSDLVNFVKKDIFEGVVAMVGGLRPNDKEAVYHLLIQLNIPVIADANSGLREALAEQLLLRGDQVLHTELPKKILRLGEVPVGRFWRDLEKLPEVEVFSVTHSGFSGLARQSTVLKGDVGRIINGIGDQMEIGDVLDHLVEENRRQNQIDELLEAFPSSEQGLIRAVSLHAATGESLYLGNSLPIREWGSFAQREIPYPEVWANRGANGIDGQISTWLGVTKEVEGAWAVLGDLTTLYDLNAPYMSEQVELQGRRLVVVNNGGGRIFGQLKRLQTISEGESERFAQVHQTEFEPFANLWGWDYLRVTCPEDLDLLEDHEGAVVIEVVPDPFETEQFTKALSANAS